MLRILALARGAFAEVVELRREPQVFVLLVGRPGLEFRQTPVQRSDVTAGEP
ncbi:hypothetical protein D3C83_331470 [compost metagenome]